MRKSTPRAVKTEQTRKKILTVGTRLLRLYGYDNTSIRQICEEAQVATGTFYHLFDSKESLLQAVFGEVNSYYTTLEMDFERDDPYRFIDEYVRESVRMYNDLGPETIFGAVVLPSGGNKTLFEPKRSSNQFVLRGLEGLRKAGKLREDIPLEEMYEEIGACLIGVVYSVYTLGETEKHEEKLRRILYHLFSSYLKEGERGGPAGQRA